jgi:serine/threonine protein phosphatase PrpC
MNNWNSPQRGKVFKSAIVSLAFVYFWTNVAMANMPPEGFWQERKAAVQAVGRGESPASVTGTQKDVVATLAQLPHPSAAIPDVTAFTKELIPRPIQEDNPHSPPGYHLPAWIKKLPLAFVSVEEIHIVPSAPLRAGPNAKERWVVLIQDVHGQPQAQRNIAEALQALSGQAPSLRVGLEGASGPLALDFYRSIPDPKIKRAIADFLLSRSMITGAEYAGMMVERHYDNPLNMEGVEDMPAYLENIRAFKDSVFLESAMRDQLNSWKDTLADLKKSLYSPTLLELDAKRRLFQDGKLSTGEYLKLLAGQHQQSGQDVILSEAKNLSVADSARRDSSVASLPQNDNLKDCPQIQFFLSALALEQSLDFSEVERQRNDLLTKMARTLSKDELQELLTLSIAYRLGQVPYGAYYRAVQVLCGSCGILLSRWPAFDKYLHYLFATEKIQRKPLFEELMRLEGQVIEPYMSGASRSLWELWSDVNLVDKLAHQNLTSLDWELYHHLRPRIQQIPERLIALTGTSFPRKRESSPSLVEMLDSFEAFYTAATRRNEALVRNTLRLSRHSDGSPLVLVSGGFHTQGVEPLFRQAGYNTIVLSPRLNKVEGNPSDYLQIFRRDQTPLDKVLLGEKLFLCPPLATGAGSDRGGAIEKLSEIEWLVEDLDQNDFASLSKERRRQVLDKAAQVIQSHTLKYGRFTKGFEAQDEIKSLGEVFYTTIRINKSIVVGVAFTQDALEGWLEEAQKLAGKGWLNTLADKLPSGDHEVGIAIFGQEANGLDRLGEKLRGTSVVPKLLATSHISRSWVVFTLLAVLAFLLVPVFTSPLMAFLVQIVEVLPKSEAGSIQSRLLMAIEALSPFLFVGMAKKKPSRTQMRQFRKPMEEKQMMFGPQGPNVDKEKKLLEAGIADWANQTVLPAIRGIAQSEMDDFSPLHPTKVGMPDGLSEERQQAWLKLIDASARHALQAVSPSAKLMGYFDLIRALNEWFSEQGSLLAHSTGFGFSLTAAEHLVVREVVEQKRYRSGDGHGISIYLVRGGGNIGSGVHPTGEIIMDEAEFDQYSKMLADLERVEHMIRQAGQSLAFRHDNKFFRAFSQPVALILREVMSQQKSVINRRTEQELHDLQRKYVLWEELCHWMDSILTESKSGERWLKDARQLPNYVQYNLSGSGALRRLYNVASADEGARLVLTRGYLELSAKMASALKVGEPLPLIVNWLYDLYDQRSRFESATVPYPTAASLGIRLLADELGGITPTKLSELPLTTANAFSVTYPEDRDLLDWLSKILARDPKEIFAALRRIHGKEFISSDLQISEVKSSPSEKLPSLTGSILVKPIPGGTAAPVVQAWEPSSDPLLVKAFGSLGFKDIGQAFTSSKNQEVVQIYQDTLARVRELTWSREQLEELKTFIGSQPTYKSLVNNLATVVLGCLKIAHLPIFNDAAKKLFKHNLYGMLVVARAHHEGHLPDEIFPGGSGAAGTTKTFSLATLLISFISLYLTLGTELTPAETFAVLSICLMFVGVFVNQALGPATKGGQAFLKEPGLVKAFQDAGFSDVNSAFTDPVIKDKKVAELYQKELLEVSALSHGDLKKEALRVIYKDPQSQTGTVSFQPDGYTALIRNLVTPITNVLHMARERGEVVDFMKSYKMDYGNAVRRLLIIARAFDLGLLTHEEIKQAAHSGKRGDGGRSASATWGVTYRVNSFLRRLGLSNVPDREVPVRFAPWFETILTLGLFSVLYVGLVCSWFPGLQLDTGIALLNAVLNHPAVMAGLVSNASFAFLGHWNGVYLPSETGPPVFKKFSPIWTRVGWVDRARYLVPLFFLGLVFHLPFFLTAALLPLALAEPLTQGIFLILAVYAFRLAVRTHRAYNRSFKALNYWIDGLIYGTPVATRTAPGRKLNEDSYLPPIRFRGGEVTMQAVIDGMGGKVRGDLASQAAIRAIKETIDEESLDKALGNNPKQSRQAEERLAALMARAMRAADAAIAKELRGRGGAVGELVLTLSNRVFVAPSGDARASVFQKDSKRLIPITVDNPREFLRVSQERWMSLPNHVMRKDPEGGDSFAFIDWNRNTPEPARLARDWDQKLAGLATSQDVIATDVSSAFLNRKEVSNHLGDGEHFPVVFAYTASTGDQVLLVTDGVSDVLTHSEMESEMAVPGSGREKARRLVAKVVERTEQLEEFRSVFRLLLDYLIQRGITMTESLSSLEADAFYHTASTKSWALKAGEWVRDFETVLGSRRGTGGLLADKPSEERRQKLSGALARMKEILDQPGFIRAKPDDATAMVVDVSAPAHLPPATAGGAGGLSAPSLGTNPTPSLRSWLGILSWPFRILGALVPRFRRLFSVMALGGLMFLMAPGSARGDWAQSLSGALPVAQKDSSQAGWFGIHPAIWIAGGIILIIVGLALGYRVVREYGSIMAERKKELGLKARLESVLTEMALNPEPNQQKLAEWVREQLVLRNKAGLFTSDALDRLAPLLVKCFSKFNVCLLSEPSKLGFPWPPGFAYSDEDAQYSVQSMEGVTDGLVQINGDRYDEKFQIIQETFAAWEIQYGFHPLGTEARKSAIQRFKREITGPYGIKLKEGGNSPPERIYLVIELLKMFPERFLRSSFLKFRLRGGINLFDSMGSQKSLGEYIKDTGTLEIRSAKFLLRPFIEILLHELGHVVESEHIDSPESELNQLFNRIKIGLNYYALSALNLDGEMRKNYVFGYGTQMYKNNTEIFAETLMHYILHGSLMVSGFEGYVKDPAPWKEVYKYYRDQVFEGHEFRFGLSTAKKSFGSRALYVLKAIGESMKSLRNFFRNHPPLVLAGLTVGALLIAGQVSAAAGVSMAIAPLIWAPKLEKRGRESINRLSPAEQEILRVKVGPELDKLNPVVVTEKDLSEADRLAPFLTLQELRQRIGQKEDGSLGDLALLLGRKGFDLREAKPLIVHNLGLAWRSGVSLKRLEEIFNLYHGIGRKVNRGKPLADTDLQDTKASIFDMTQDDPAQSMKPLLSKALNTKSPIILLVNGELTPGRIKELEKLGIPPNAIGRRVVVVKKTAYLEDGLIDAKQLVSSVKEKLRVYGTYDLELITSHPENFANLSRAGIVRLIVILANSMAVELNSADLTNALKDQKALHIQA